MTYLLDTDTCIEMMRGNAQRAIAKAATTKASEICLSSIVRFELLTGARRSARPEAELQKVEIFSQKFMLLDFDDRCAAEAAWVRSELESRGSKIGPYDTLIAGVGRAYNLVVVTRNLSEFRRVRGLRVEDWQA